MAGRTLVSPLLETPLAGRDSPEDKRARVLREFEASLAEPKDIPDHPDLNIFL
jgi:hypothetical protein